MFSLSFDQKFNGDVREEPVASFEFMNQKYGLLAPELEFWYQLFIIISATCAACAIIGGIAYKLIIPSRQSSPTLSFLLVFGVLAPIVVSVPYITISLFAVENLQVVFAGGVHPFVTLLRLVETLYGFSPKGVEGSLGNFMLYYAAPIECVFDAKAPRKATGLDKLLGLRIFLVSYIQLSAVLSIMGFVFSGKVMYPDNPESIYDGGFLRSCLSRKRLLTNFLFACE